MNQQLAEMSIAELKAYIKTHRHDARAFHEALNVMLSRTNPDAKKYPADLSEAEMEAIFKARIDQNA